MRCENIESKFCDRSRCIWDGQGPDPVAPVAPVAVLLRRLKGKDKEIINSISQVFPRHWSVRYRTYKLYTGKYLLKTFKCSLYKNRMSGYRSLRTNRLDGISGLIYILWLTSLSSQPSRSGTSTSDARYWGSSSRISVRQSLVLRISREGEMVVGCSRQG